MPDFIEPLRRRLVELGCPIKQMQRLVREVADHRDDLKQAALAQGLSEADAVRRANAQLGDLLFLAEQMMTTLRRSSWWGRHHIVAFGLLPVLVFPVLWLLCLFLELALVVTLGYRWNEEKLHVAANDSITFQHVLVVFHLMDYLAVALAALLFCWLAQHAAVKLKWMAISCAICSLIAVIVFARLEPHSFFVGFSANGHLQMPWYRGAIPLLVALAMYVFQRRTIRRFQKKVAI
jgi:hypothetical protein